MDVPLDERLPMNPVNFRERYDVAVGAALFVLGTASRIPFRSTILYHWDSVNFALATQSFDISIGQPHTPGYILYVGAGKMLSLLTHDPQVNFVRLSAIFSGLAIAAIFWLGKAMFGRLSGLVASGFLATSPLFWFYGEIALPHVLDAFFVIWLTFLLYKITLGEEKLLPLAAAVLGIAGGLRPQTSVFLFPLCIFACRRVRRTRLVPALLLCGAICALWFIPLIWLSGGLARYLEMVTAFSARFDTSTSIFLEGGTQGLFRNLQKLVRYTLYGWGLAMLPVLAYVMHQRLVLTRILRSQKTRFFLLWVLPALFFYVFIHMGQQGLVFVFLPVLLVLSAESAVRLYPSLHKNWRGYTLHLSLAVLIVGNSCIFLLAPEHLVQGNRFKILSWSTIRNLDDYYATRISTVRHFFSPETSVLLAYHWRHVSYYLPEYEFIPFAIAEGDEPVASSPGGVPSQRIMEFSDIAWPDPTTEWGCIVLFDDGLYRYSDDLARTKVVTMPGGEKIYFLTWRQGERFAYGPAGLGFVDRAERKSH